MLAYGLSDLAENLIRQGRLAEAETVQRESVATVKTAWGEGHYEVTVQLANLAEILRDEGKNGDSELLYRELIEHGNTRPLNRLAWQLATSPDSKVQDGQNALLLAGRAVAATSRTNAMYLNTLAAAYAVTGQFTNAVNVQREAIALLSREDDKDDYTSRLKLYESHSPYTDPTPLAYQTRDLLTAGKFAEAEALARECLVIRERQIPDDWRVFNTRSMLGGALLGQKKYAEAEPLLLSGYEGMEQREDKIPAAGRMRPKEAMQRLVQLYEETSRPDQAAEWKQKLAELEKAQTGLQRTAPSR